MDPDPAFLVNEDPDADRIHSFDDQKLKKIIVFFLKIKTCNWLSLGRDKGRP